MIEVRGVRKMDCGQGKGEREWKGVREGEWVRKREMGQWKRKGQNEGSE